MKTHAQATAIEATPTAAYPFIPLDAVDLQILILLADGNDTARIATKLELTQKNVSQRLRRAATKANATTREHLLATALRKRWIS